ncbi:uncharacterized protein LOC106666370 [Cimex lectularius]|uniref:Uncharacterized protein n=1 Tax=Cimex lectularius TaxID=79782 RepID=A0A8I6RRW9_CIMLE|nr:uncharacterized protein LOC106666370 [Cimex lectularius]
MATKGVNLYFLPRTKQCCCYHSLHVGTKIISWVFIAVGSIAIFSARVTQQSVGDFPLLVTLYGGIILITAVFNHSSLLIKLWLIFAACIVLLFIINIIINIVDISLKNMDAIAKLFADLLWISAYSYAYIIVYNFYVEDYWN